MTDIEIRIRKRHSGDKLIGRYTVSPRSMFKDIRGYEGEVLDILDLRPEGLTIDYPEGGLVPEAFYEFKWSVDESTGKFYIVDSPVAVENDAFLRRLLDINLRKVGGDLAQAVQDQALASDEITGAQHTYLYELLQNANDYPYCEQDVKVRFVLTDNYLFFLHSGAAFDLLNIVGICSRHQGQKADKVGTIGYKGIGFKTVFVKNDYVYLKTGDWSMRFDKRHSSDEKGGGETPWTIMPWPTSEHELDDEVRCLLSTIPDEFRVQFALRHNEDASEHIQQLDKVFGNDEILLFIPHVTDVEVVNRGSMIHHVTKDREKWEIVSFETPVSDDLKEWVKEDRKNGGKTPKKFENIQAVQISFAVPKNGKFIIPMEGERTRVYNYLPTELRLGFPFFLNADFIPDASRSGLHPGLKWNDTVMSDCGRRFVDWFASLLSEGDAYDIPSVFSLVPTNNTTTDHYTSLFMNSMNKALGEKECIPVLKDGVYSLKSIPEVIYDLTGLTNGSNPVLTDQEFYTLSGIEGYLPHPDCRHHENLEWILKNHKASSIRFDGTSLSNMARRPEFRDWLAVRENNIRFLKFLLETGFMMNFLNEDVVLQDNGALGKPSAMFLDIDRYMEDLAFLSDMLPRMDTQVRDALASVRGWNDYKERFKQFNAFSFIKDRVLANIGSLLSARFSSIENSVRFFHFMAIVGYDWELPYSYPFYGENGEKVGRNNLFVKDSFGEEFSKLPWIKPEWVSFVNERYFEKDEVKTKQFTFSKGIKNITPETACSLFLGNDSRMAHIASVVNSDFGTNLQFYRYYSTLDVSMKLSEESRKLLKVYTTDGNTLASSSIRDTIFYRSPEWESVRKERWLPSGIGRAIADEYLEDASASSIKSFFNAKSIACQFSMSGFFTGVMEGHRKEIFALINDKECSRSFLDFLFRNNQTFFKGEVPTSAYKDIPVFLQDSDTGTTANKEGGIFYHTEMLDEIIAQPWYPDNELVVLDHVYDDIFDGKERKDFFKSLGLLTLDQKKYVLESVFKKKDLFRNILEDRDCNVSFHHYFSDKQRLFTDDEYAPLKQFPIFISSPDFPGGTLEDSSTNHYIPSEQLIQFITKDLVPRNILHSIHPDYIRSDVDKTYLEKIGNKEIADDSFISYITSEHNLDSVCTYLSADRARNIRFWRWACDTKVSYDDKKALRLLPVLIKGSEDVYVTTEKTYIPDEYTDMVGEESLVREFIKDAQFISPEYIAEDDGRDWKTFFQALGVIVGGRDIVFRKVLPNLGDEQYWTVAVIPLIAGYYQEIQSRIGKEDKLKSELANLHLKTADGEYEIPEEVFISGRFFDIESEPLPDVRPGYFVSEEYLAQDNPKVLRNVKDFMRLIADTFGAACDTKTKIRNEKIKYFCQNQSDYSSERQVHDRIIRDLSNEYSADRIGVEEIIKDKGLPIVKLYSQGGQLFDSNHLTLGTSFEPDCDFMAGGVDEIDYADEKYATLSPNMKEFFVSVLHVMDGFGKDDLDYLRYPRFAEYFWQKYAPEHQNSLELILTEENLRTRNCIPTITGVKRPCDLYDYRRMDLKTMIDRIYPEGTDLMSCVNLPRWIPADNRLGFRQHLYLDDCLKYLALEYVDYRRDVIEWIIRCDDSIIHDKEDAIKAYLQNANWLNGKKDWVPLSGLVALEKDNKTLDAYFKSNAYVCNPSYMPIYKENYNRMCDIFHIQRITDDDFKKEPDGKSYRDEEAVVEIKKRLAYLSFISGKAEWDEIYKRFEEALDNTDIRRCERILYRYDDNIKTELKVYKDGKDMLWYTKPWDGAPIGDIISWLIQKLSIKDILRLNDGLIQNVFWDDIETVLNNYEGGEIPQKLYDILADLGKIDVSIREELEEKEFSDDNFTQEGAQTNSGSRSVSENVSEGDSPRRHRDGDSVQAPSAHQEEHTETSEAGREHPMQTSTTSVNDEPVDGGVDTEAKDDSVRNDVADTTQSEKTSAGSQASVERNGGSHSSPQSGGARASGGHTAQHTNTVSDQRTKNEESSVDDKPRESMEERLSKEWESRRNMAVRRPSSKTYGFDTGNQSSNQESSTATEDDFFSKDTSHGTGFTAASKTSQRVNRSFTDAQNSVNKAQDKVDLMSLFTKETDENKYSFRWFNLLMKLMYSERMKETHRDIQIDFAEHVVLDGGLLVLTKPSKPIPSWIEGADHMSVSLMSRRKTISATVSSRTDDALWLTVPAGIDISDFSEDMGRVRLNADGTSFTFIDALMTRFIQLGYEDSYNLRDNLPETIQYIYGPPGTGKTTELVRLIKDSILEGDDMSCFIVLAPTNRAADEVAERLLADESSAGHVWRYGTTESSQVIVSGHLISRDSSFCAMEGPNVLITTIHRFAYDYLDSSTAICEWIWDKVFIDEASMIDIASITYVLHKVSAGTPVVIAGDPMQIQPIEENDIQPENIYQMVGIESFAAASRRPDVIALRKQYRSVPEIGELVSQFSYDGLLEHDRTDSVEQPLELTGYKHLGKINFVGFRLEPLDQIYGIDSVSQSPFHIYSVILAYSFAEYIANEVTRLGYNDYTVGIVCPYKQQASAITDMLENRPIETSACRVRCGTVHKFQGGECDTVIVVMNPPADVTSGTHINNQNIVNVAISRARDTLFMLVPDHKIPNFWTRDKLGNLSGGHSIAFSRDIEKMMFGSENFIERNTSVTCHMPTNVYNEPTRMYEVRIDENAVDIRINEALRED